MLPDATRKDRMISLRITEKDYRRLQRICKREGVRSLSALARIALHRMVIRDGNLRVDSSANERLREMEQRVEDLETVVRTVKVKRGVN
jgi:hypothetical protein